MAFANDPLGSRSRPRMSNPRPPYLRLVVALGFWMLGLGALPAIARADEPVEQWGIFEIALEGVSTGNPFLDVDLSARFSQGDRVLTVPGFYDGDGVYRIRFMPDGQGR